MSEIEKKTENIYRTIMERLITEMKDDLLSEGCNEEVLKQLKTIWESKMIEAGIFNPNKEYQQHQTMNPNYQQIVKTNQNLNYEYSPNNSTSQNVELYKQKQNQYQNIQNNYPYQDMHLISTEQVNYNNVPFNSLKPNPFYMPQNDYFSSTYQAEYKPSMMNINKDVNDSYSNQLNSKTLNISTVNNINNNKDNNNINSINNNNKEDKGENQIEDPDEIMFRQQDNKDKENSKKDDESELSDDTEKNSDNENDFSDHLLAQYEKVKRVKNKWKVTLKGCVVQKDNKEYICGKVHGELEREW